MAKGYDITFPAKLMKNENYGWRYNGTFDEPWYSVAAQGYDRKADSINSNYKDPTPYSRNVVRIIEDRPYRTEQYTWDGTRFEANHLSSWESGVDPYPGDAWTPLLNNAEDKAVTRAREKLRSKDSFNIGVAVAEARSTAELLAGRGTDMANALLAFRRHAFSFPTNVREYILKVAGAWLEGYYGWGSLARDAFGLDAALRSKVQEPLDIFVQSTIKTSSKMGPSNIDAIRRRRWDVEGLARVGYHATIESEFARNLDKWGLLNPFEIAWEVMPYSFCVDWLMPVGNTLSSLSATAGLKFESGYITRFHKARISTDYWNLNPYPRESVVTDRGSYVVESVVMNRRLTPGFEIPRLYANENPFSTPRVTSAVALITQAVLGR